MTYLSDKYISKKSFMKFTHAITRKPDKNFANGITTSSLGQPDVKLAVYQHEKYCEALRDAGLQVVTLDAMEKFPDGCFVEDTAIVTEKDAIITRPGDPTRRNEVDHIADILSGYKKLQFISEPGTVDGGDILRIGSHFYIGLSYRTNEAGAKQLGHYLSTLGFTSSEIEVGNVLHLKTGASFIGNNSVLCIDELQQHFGNHNTVTVSLDEDYFSNTILVNNTLIVAKGFPNTFKKINQYLEKQYLNQKLQQDVINIVELDMSEFRKMDGGLTCLSLLW